MSRPHRVAVVGSSCSGKSTFARSLAVVLGAPHVELDALFWEPGWTAAAPETFAARVTAAVATQTWVVDGNFSAVRELVWAKADTVVWLDPPLATVLRRFFARSISRALSREPLWNGCYETLGNSIFSRNSLLIWILSHFAEHRRVYAARMADPAFAHLRFLRLRTARDANDLLAGLAHPATA